MDIPESYLKFFNADGPQESQWSSLAPQEGLKYAIFSDHVSSRLTSLDELFALQAKLSNWISNHSQDYIWHHHPFSLSIIVPDSSAEELHLGGTINFGDNIEDEWFIVYLFLKMTKEMEDEKLSISIQDDDGQFLLIEAADALPEWLNPENSENRVWLRNGQICIVPDKFTSVSYRAQNSQLGEEHHCINLADSLRVIREEESGTALVHEGITNAIKHRVSSYPLKFKALKHTALGLLPQSIVDLLIENPSLISSVIQAFDTQDIPREAKRQYYSAMSKFGGDLSTLENIAPASIQMTRQLYALITFKPFHLPKKFQKITNSIERKVVSNGFKNALPPGASDNCDGLMKAWDLGARIVCGLEVAYQYSKRYELHKKGDGSLEGKWQKLLEISQKSNQSLNLDKLKAACLSGEIEVAGQGQQKSSRTINRNEEFPIGFRCKSSVSGKLESACTVIDESLSRQGSKSSEKHAKSIVMAAVDSDAWMYLSLEKLEDEMQSRIMQLQGNHPSKSAAPGNVIEIDEEKEGVDAALQGSQSTIQSKLNDELSQLNKVLDNFNLFLDKESGIEGVENLTNTDEQKMIEEFFGDNGSDDDSDDEEVGSSYNNANNDRGSVKLKTGNGSQYVKSIESDGDGDSDDSAASEGLFGVPSKKETKGLSAKSSNGSKIGFSSKGSTVELASGTADTLQGCGHGLISSSELKDISEVNSRDDDDRIEDSDDELGDLSNDKNYNDFMDAYLVSH